MFQRLYRKKEDELPPATPLQTQKKRQIENIKANYENVTEVVNEIDYRIPIKVGDVYLSLIILLPPHFPQDGPTIHVSPSVVHPWVNKEQQIVGCISLKNFTMHSDLGKTIQEIIEEFNRRPPVLDNLSRTDIFEQPLTAYPHDPTALIGHPYVPAAAYSEISSIEGMMDRRYHFPELSTLSAESLEQMSNDDQQLTVFVNRLPFFQRVESELDCLRTQNESLACKNVEKQPKIQELRENVTKKGDASTALKLSFEEHNRHFQCLVEQYSPAALSENLKIAAMQAEEESDKIAFSFLDGKFEVDEFLNKFLEKRTLYHLRRIKEEKLQAQIHETQKMPH